MRYSVGDILISRYKEERKILGICGEVYFVSIVSDFEVASDMIFTQIDLNDTGYTLKESAPWRPERGDQYWFIDHYGDVENEAWVWEDKNVDIYRLKTNNVFRTKQEAQKRLDEIMK